MCALTSVKLCDCQVCLPTSGKTGKQNDKDATPQLPKLDDDAQRKLIACPGLTPVSSVNRVNNIRYKEKALRIVRTHVLLIPEEKNAAQMEDALKKTAVPSWSGEVAHHANESLGCPRCCAALICLLQQNAAEEPPEEVRLHLLRASDECSKTCPFLTPTAEVQLRTRSLRVKRRHSPTFDYLRYVKGDCRSSCLLPWGVDWHRAISPHPT